MYASSLLLTWPPRVMTRLPYPRGRPRSPSFVQAEPALSTVTSPVEPNS